jgi:hypothetical protein
LIEIMSLGRKIFVCRDVVGMDEAEVMAPFHSLNLKSPSTLLWMTEARAGQTPGAVEEPIAGLMQAYPQKPAPRKNPVDASAAAWPTVCLNASHLGQKQTGDRHE